MGEIYAPFMSDGFVSIKDGEKKSVRILRDSGASQSFILEHLLPFSASTDTGSTTPVLGITLVPLSVPLHRLSLWSDLVNGEVVMGVRSSLPVDGVDVILGNDLAGAGVWKDGPPLLVVTETPECTKSSDECAKQYPKVFPVCAVTRAQSRASSETKELVSEEIQVQAQGCPWPFPAISKDEIIAEQTVDPSLAPLFQLVCSEEKVQELGNGYFLREGVLCRKWTHVVDDIKVDQVIQVVVPSKFRNVVLGVAHNGVAGHLGVKKTYDRVLRHFFWPRLKRDVSAFCKTCHTCQMTGKPNQKIRPAPLCPIAVTENPFEYLLVDCVGPLPKSKSGNNYLLTVMCKCTRYPAAFPLRSIKVKPVLKALNSFMSTFGIPKVIQTDQGSNFMSRTFTQVLKQLQVKHNVSSAYHPESQGALERFHQTLKSMLRCYCTELSQDWEEGLPWLLLAVREVCQESTGFSPNELVFGHTVRGPLAVLSDHWKTVDPPENILDYVNDFRCRLYNVCATARRKLGMAQEKMKDIFDRKAKVQSFEPGDQVLILLPVVGSPFQAKFHGPYTVKSRMSECDYLINTPDRRKKVQWCHVNLLKPYHDRVSSVDTRKGIGVGSMSSSQTKAACVVAKPVNVPSEDFFVPSEQTMAGKLNNSDYLSNLQFLLRDLSDVQKTDLVQLINSHLSLFSDTPTRTNLVEHDIDVGDSKPIKQRFYRVPVEKRLRMEKEVDYMLANGIAEPAVSNWASPCLLVPKYDASDRFCTDFRKVNAVSKPDCYPLPRIEDCVDEVGSAKFVTKLDLLKGYWQVPLTPRAKEICTFVTPKGLFSYNVMPFGLRNAPATFQRLMNRVLDGLSGCTAYLDDVVVYSDSWDDHVQRLKALFDRLVEANLTINLSKCEFAKATVTYLGKVVGQGKVRPVSAKVEAIDNYPIPKTKKELQRFLGLVGYYRGFCQNFSTVVAPLTNLLSKKISI